MFVLVHLDCVFLFFGVAVILYVVSRTFRVSLGSESIIVGKGTALYMAFADLLRFRH